MLLELREISKAFDEVPVLTQVSLTLERGASLAVVAPSGTGKSTLLALAGLLLTPSAGSVLLSGIDTAALSDTERSHLRAQHIGFLFQHTQLVGALRALDNVMVSASFAPRSAAASVQAAPTVPAHAMTGQAAPAEATPVTSVQAAPAKTTPVQTARTTRAKQTNRARELLCALGLAERLHHFPHQLSVGQKRRVALARALFLRPALLIADEPTNDLDAANAALVIEQLFKPVRSGQAALLFATHDETLAAQADTIVRLNEIR